jgi:hypothetical protein
MALRFLVIAAAIISLAAIAICSLAPSAYMTELPFTAFCQPTTGRRTLFSARSRQRVTKGGSLSVSEL